VSKGAFAKEEVMEEYLSALLEEPILDDKVQRDTVAKLLETAVPPVELTDTAEDIKTLDISVEESKVISPQVDNKEVVDEFEQTETDLQSSSQSVPIAVKESVRPTGEFQALFFEVSGLKLAVQLTELGGIHQLEKVSPLFGKPDWFNGVMLHRDEKLSVVDTAKWVMPEKYDEKLAESLNYQYLIMLDDSCWGLACERIVTTAVLNPGDVKWRETTGKRPWLAGMVKEKMCALINVQQLIAMLEQGQSSNEK
jgi:purine-binding chemotaxis protein CheW